MRRMPCAMGKRDVGSDAPGEDSFLLWLYPDNYLRWKISHDPHAAGTDKGNLRDAGETCACQVIIWISINKQIGYHQPVMAGGIFVPIFSVAASQQEGAKRYVKSNVISAYGWKNR